MSDTENKPAQTPPPFEVEFDGKKHAFDLAKAEDRKRLETLTQSALHKENLGGKIRQLEEEVGRLKPDAEQAQAIKTFAAASPVGAAVVRDLISGISQGRLDPSQVRAALAANQQGGAEGVEAQARAVAQSDPQASAALHSLAEELKALRAETGSIKAAQLERDREAAISSALSREDFLKGRPALSREVHRRTRELIASEGMNPDLAARKALEESRELVNESVQAKERHLQAGQEMSTVKPGAAAIPAFEPKTKVDPKASKRERQEQLRKLAHEKFAYHQRLTNGSLLDGPSQ